MQDNCIKIELISVTKKGDNTIIKLDSVTRTCKHPWEK